MINYNELTIENSDALVGKNVRLVKVFKNRNDAKCKYTLIITHKDNDEYKTFKYFGCKSINEYIDTLYETFDNVNEHLYTFPVWFNVTKQLHTFNDGNTYHSFEWTVLPPKNKNT